MGKIPKVALPFLKGKDERIFSPIADLDHWVLVIYNIPWPGTALQIENKSDRKFLLKSNFICMLTLYCQVK